MLKEKFDARIKECMDKNLELVNSDKLRNKYNII